MGSTRSGSPAVRFHESWLPTGRCISFASGGPACGGDACGNRQRVQTNVVAIVNGSSMTLLASGTVTFNGYSVGAFEAAAAKVPYVQSFISSIVRRA